MKKQTLKHIFATIALSSTLMACGQSQVTTSSKISSESSAIATASQSTATTEVAASTTEDDDVFTKRDKEQTADLSEATYYTVADGQDITITTEGIYVLSGTASEATIFIEASDSDKVQLVLNNLNVTNTSEPVIYVKTADKVFITTTQGSSNSLAVASTFTADGDTNTDAVIYSKEDLTLNGLGTLTINSSANAITSKDDLKVTGGTYNIVASAHALEANDSINIADGIFTIDAGKDGLHCENDEDMALGNVYIITGTFNITSASDAIHALATIRIDGGTYTINAREGLEATYIQVNGGDITINASDDGINATTSSNAYTPTVEITGGTLTVNMGSGDTDAIDSNGDLIISGGTINIYAQYAFDFDGSVSFTGGTVYVNGTQVTSIANSMMGGNMPGQMNGRH